MFSENFFYSRFWFQGQLQSFKITNIQLSRLAILVHECPLNNHGTAEIYQDADPDCGSNIVPGPTGNGSSEVHV